MEMTLEEAIKTAIEYETRIHDLYQKAATTITDPVGQQVLKALGTDELHHLTYLTGRLEVWQKTGELVVEDLETTLLPLDEIDRDVQGLESGLKQVDRGDEKLLLSRALKIELETSEFYRKMALEMSDQAQRMFSRFLALENEHVDVVQAELDYLSKTGYWFGFKEFDME
jgi:rubrerythrin